MCLADLECRIGNYKRAIETYNKASWLYTEQNNLVSRNFNINEIDFINILNQEIIKSKNELLEACQKFIEEV